MGDNLSGGKRDFFFFRRGKFQGALPPFPVNPELITEMTFKTLI